MCLASTHLADDQQHGHDEVSGGVAEAQGRDAVLPLVDPAQPALQHAKQPGEEGGEMRKYNWYQTREWGGSWGHEAWEAGH